MKDSDKKFVELAIKKLVEAGIEESRDGEIFCSLREWYESKGFLTPKQLKLLTDIFERN